MDNSVLDRLLAQIEGKAERKEGGSKQGKKGKQLNITDYYLCLVYDKSDQIYYIVGGIETTEKLVENLTQRKKPHTIHEYAVYPRDFREKTQVERNPYKIVSKNRATASGMSLDLSFPHKKVVVLPGTGEFHILVWNHRGRRSKVR